MKYQAKNIPDESILSVLADYQGQWSFWSSNNSLKFGKDKNGMNIEKYEDWHSIQVVPSEVPHKVFFAKLKSLHKRGLTGGCVCGCRGDFEITDKGLKLIGRERVRPYTGY